MDKTPFITTNLDKSITLKDLVALWASQIDNTQAYSPSAAHQNNHRFPLMDKVLTLTNCTVFVIDSLYQYTYMSSNCENVIGYTAQELISGGITFFTSLIHPEDLPNVLKAGQIFSEYVISLPVEQRQKVMYNCSYRVRKKDGTYIVLLNRSFILDMDINGKVLNTFCVAIDVTNLKKATKDNIIFSLSVENMPPIIYQYNEKLVIEPNTNFFTPKEIEIMKLLEEQLSSKEIAEKLFVSPHTIDTHRRNLLEKTNTKDTNSLVSYAKLIAWI